jgi:hypothetical protein
MLTTTFLSYFSKECDGTDSRCNAEHQGCYWDKKVPLNTTFLEQYDQRQPVQSQEHAYIRKEIQYHVFFPRSVTHRKTKSLRKTLTAKLRTKLCL